MTKQQFDKSIKSRRVHVMMQNTTHTVRISHAKAAKLFSQYGDMITVSNLGSDRVVGVEL